MENNYPQQPAGGKKGIAIAGLVLGVIGLVFMCIPLFQWIGMIAGLIGLILSIIGKKQGAGGVATAGLVCSIIALILSTIFFIACVVCVGCVAGTPVLLESLL